MKEFEEWWDDYKHPFPTNMKSKIHRVWIEAQINLVAKVEELEQQIDKLKDALDNIERHRDSTLWPQNDTVKSMANIAKEALEMSDD